ncbi:hypothetical protein U9M48_027016 [Paspalum notatum var. saurae]|uniref:Mitochondrial transcription termination factor family protein n=1 Tax=Paspalum notatum var. saurae TaxID=547442 RepID=A0AAQ3WYX8_PASNO
MLFLQKQLLLHLHRSAPPVRLSLQRALLSTAAAAGSSSPIHFAAEEYLVATCGLTREQAAKAAKWISHWKSPSQGDAVLAFLTGPALGLSKAEIASLVATEPRVLNCRDKTLRARLDSFRSHGFSAAQIRSFIRSNPVAWCSLDIGERLGFWVSFFGSPDKFLRISRRSLYLASSDLGKVKTNIRLLHECGLSNEQIGSMCVTNPRLLTARPDSTRAIIVRADEFGVPRNLPMFKQVVSTMAALRPETVASKMEIMGEALGCSDAELTRMVQRNPVVLWCSREKVLSVFKFLIDVVGVDPKCIQASLGVVTRSMERVMVPRHYVKKVLQENGLIQKEQNFCAMVMLSEKLFCSKYIHPHKDVIPGLANAYASACKGKIDT